jgi:hypothetical protein
MSSHHFVKEDQEPALLIINPSAISFEKIQELLEWSPTLLVVEEALPTVLGWGIKIDVVLCLEGSQDKLAASLADQVPIRFVTFPKRPDTLSAGYCFLQISRQKAVNILVDRLEALEQIQSFSSIDVEVFFAQKRWVFVRSKRFAKWLPKGTHLSSYPIVQMTVLNLSEQLVCLQDGVAEIKSDVPFWIGEELT